jgi:hypothetical protein
MVRQHYDQLHNCLYYSLSIPLCLCNIEKSVEVPDVVPPKPVQAAPALSIEAGAKSSVKEVIIQPVVVDKGSSVIKKKFILREAMGDKLPYPGSDFLGFGYNFMRGNPDGDPKTKLDPGFRLPIVRLEWCQVAECATRDGRHLQPKGGYAIPVIACNHATKASTNSRAGEYSMVSHVVSLLKSLSCIASYFLINLFYSSSCFFSPIRSFY